VQIAGVTLEAFGDGAERAGGVDLRDLPSGTTLLVKTLNSTYEVVVVAGCEVCVRGGAHFPDPTRACVDGASGCGSALRFGWIGVGMHAELQAGSQRIVTSRVCAITVLPAKACEVRLPPEGPGCLLTSVE
jgi:hypothetical protein